MHTENLNDIEKQKIRDLRELHNYRQELRKSPQLRRLFFELTLRCNENCVHCGSRCGEVQTPELSKAALSGQLRIEISVKAAPITAGIMT